MSQPSYFDKHVGIALQEYLELPRDRAAARMRSRIPDLLHFLRDGRAPSEVRAPRRTAKLAASLESALAAGTGARGHDLQHLRDRILTDDFLRSEYDRDQNVYLGPLFTRILTRAIPDVVFQPKTHREVELALAWARDHRVGITTRGAGSTALGGAVPNDGGLLLEMSRFDLVQVDRTDGVAVIGAGARFKKIHAELASQGLALATYPSNLGGTLAGWFSAGGLGLNAFAHGPVQAHVRALTMVLPGGEHLRLHADGRLDVLSPESRRLTAEEGRAWLEKRGLPALGLADLAGSEGQFGVILTLTVRTVALARFVPFYFEFDSEARAIDFARWVAADCLQADSKPANLKFLSATHVAAMRRARGDAPGTASPAVYVDFDDEAAARRFQSRLQARAEVPRRDASAAQRAHDDRFRPQQTKRFGPGYLAAEVLLPTAELAEYLKGATRLAARVGVHLETEVYFLADGRALAIPGYCSRGPRRGFVWELLLAPMLLDLAMARHAGVPYVLGRWQSPYFNRSRDRDARRHLRAMKRRFDPRGTLNPGVFFTPTFRVPGVHGTFRATFPGVVRLLRALYGGAVTAPLFRALIGAAALEQSPSRTWRSERRRPFDHEAVGIDSLSASWPPARLAQEARGCVNCGECNAACPVFDDSGIRLPQMLTHLGEQLEKKGELAGTPQLLLDLCMRCGNCQEVCQADIPHLPLYAALERRAGIADQPRQERHVAVLSHLRHADRYRTEFLKVRPGGYLQRTPASLPGEVRFLLFRAENDAGPIDTCLHCGACVPVCPTAANQEFQEPADLRRISTDLNRCIGCGACVEVCPANLTNGGRTLRVMEAPSREFFQVFAAFETVEEGSGR